MRINLKFLLLLITALNAHADLMVEFDNTPAEQIEVDNILTENVNLFLSVDARLDYPQDYPGMKVILGYDFVCGNDNPSHKNRLEQGEAHSELIGVKLRYDTARPNLWDEWPSGPKT